jgi:hypothetical protein
MSKYIITTTIKEEVEAVDKDDAREKFFNLIEDEPQQTIETYLAEHLKVENKK